MWVFMHGLPASGMPRLPQSAAEHIAEYRFRHVRSEENRGSGITPLHLAVISGNSLVVDDLLDENKLDEKPNVNSRTRTPMLEFGFSSSVTALHFAASVCPQPTVVHIISSLLRAGADVNLTAENGITPLISAVKYRSSRGVQALLGATTSSASVVRVDTEKQLKSDGATALSIAASESTGEILGALLNYGADLTRADDHGLNVFMRACMNPTADVEMMELLSPLLARTDINAQIKNNRSDWKTSYAVRKLVLVAVCCSVFVEMM